VGSSGTFILLRKLSHTRGIGNLDAGPEASRQTSQSHWCPLGKV
jgi:hypothetical protein